MKKTSLHGFTAGVTGLAGLTGKVVGIIGMARSGIAAANFAKRKGARVLVSESRAKAACGPQLKLLAKGIDTEFGGHSNRLFLSDVIVKSPGVHGDIPVLREAARRGIPVWSEIELAARFTPNRRIVAITGTNGKTTTTALTGEIFKNAGKTVVAGNIGTPFAAAASRVTPGTDVVLEVSSYQLEDSPSFHPRIAAVLNITPDHIEHHHTMANYIAAKARIFANQTKRDCCVLNYDDPACRKLARRCPSKVVFFSRKKRLAAGAYYEGGKIVVRLPGRRFAIACRPRIPGMHNVENILAAAAMAAAGGIKPSVIERVVNAFPGVEHRIEHAGEIGGVRYFNDSKGTNVDSTRVALESFSEPVWLILGGRDKGAPYAPLKKLIGEKVRGILLIGEAAPLIRKQLKGAAEFHECGTMRGAVKTARRLARPGEIVLLSPACASFDQFTDYEDRGRQFKKLVRAPA